MHWRIFLIWQSRVLPHRVIVCEIIFKFGDFPQNRQLTKLKTSPKFPAIRYTLSFDYQPTILRHSYGAPHTKRPSAYRSGSCNDIGVLIVGMEVVKSQCLSYSINNALESLSCLTDRDVDQVLYDNAITRVLRGGTPGQGQSS